MEYSEAVSLLRMLASRLDECSEYNKYVANEIARLNNLDKAGGSEDTRPPIERDSTIGG